MIKHKEKTQQKIIKMLFWKTNYCLRFFSTNSVKVYKTFTIYFSNFIDSLNYDKARTS